MPRLDASTLIPAARWTWLLIAALAMPAAAQETVVPKRNVRTGWAQVLRVDPVYQTLTATAMEEQCEGDAPGDAERRGLSRIVGAVKDALSREEAPPVQPRPGCRMVPVQRKYRRPIAYDVDYVYRGMKYRSRLPYDPGNRLRVQVSILPVVADANGNE
jgi:uncharacterized protein YcfJ